MSVIYLWIGGGILIALYKRNKLGFPLRLSTYMYIIFTWPIDLIFWLSDRRI